MNNRNYNREFADTDDRKYAYDFDYLMHDYLLRVFSEHFKGGDALELGCFEGEFTRKLQQHFKSVTVVEAASNLIEIARSKVRRDVEFHLSRFETVDLPMQKFDAIFLMHTLEHLDEPQVVLRRIRDWLSPEGKLYVAVPNANAISRQLAVKMGKVAYQSCVTEAEYLHGHRRTYTLDALEFEIRTAGLTSNQSGGVFFKPFANFQFDRLISEKIIDNAYLEACFELGKKYPDFCASIFSISQTDLGKES